MALPRARVRAIVDISIALVAMAALGLAFLMGRNDTVPPIDALDIARVDAGEVLYAARCASCHGANLEGQPNWRERMANGRLPAPPHDESGHTWHHPDDVLFGITKLGLGPYAPEGYESDMPAFDGVLSDEEIAAVLAYIKSRWPKEVRARQQRINDQARSQ